MNPDGKFEVWNIEPDKTENWQAAFDTFQEAFDYAKGFSNSRIYLHEFLTEINS